MITIDITGRTPIYEQICKSICSEISNGILNENDTNNMVSKLGQKVYLSKGSDLNIKINTVEDVEMFKSLYNMGNRDRQE